MIKLFLVSNQQPKWKWTNSLKYMFINWTSTLLTIYNNLELELLIYVIYLKFT